MFPFGFHNTFTQLAEAALKEGPHTAFLPWGSVPFMAQVILGLKSVC